MYGGELFETNVLANLRNKLTKEEKEVALFESDSTFDVLLPLGCKALRLPHDTIVEIKRRLVFDTIYRLANRLKQFSEKTKKEYHLFIIYDDAIKTNSFFVPEKLGSDIKIRSVKELFCKEPPIKKSYTFTLFAERKKDWKDLNKERIIQATKKFREGCCTFFIGAGVSKSAGLPSWDELLKNILREMTTDSKGCIKENDIEAIKDCCSNSALIIGRYLRILSGYDRTKLLVDDKEKRKNFNRLIHKSLYGIKPKLGSVLIDKIVAAVKTKKVSGIVTYNYDDLLETQLRKMKLWHRQYTMEIE